MNRIQGFTEQGNTTLVITGAVGTITRKVEGSFPSCTVTIYQAGTVTVAAIYADDAGTPKANPFTAGSDGTWFAYVPNGGYDVLFSGGGIAVPFTIGGMWAFDESSVFVDVTASPFLADKSGAVDSAAAIQAAVSSIQSGVVFFPAGTYTVSATITIARSRTNLIGVGQQASILHYTGSGSAIKFTTGSSGTAIAQNRINGLALDGTSNTNVKAAIEIADGEEIEIADIAVSNWHDATNACKGIHLRGRQTIMLSRCTVSADSPVVISKNSSAGQPDADHYHFEDLYLLATANPNITVDSGVSLTNFTADGYQAWVGGTFGFNFTSTTDTIASYSINIIASRWEQGTGAAGYAIKLSNTNGFYAVNLIGNYGSPAKGFYLASVANGMFSGNTYAGTSEALKLVGDVRMTFASNWFNIGSATIDFTGGVNSTWINNDGDHKIALGSKSPTNQLVIPNNTSLAGVNAAGNAEIAIAKISAGNLINIAPAAQATYVGGQMFVGNLTSPATHQLSIPNATFFGGGNVAATNTIALLGTTTTDQIYVNPNGVDVKIGQSVIGPGGGAAATLNTIGGSGPATAAQNGWMKFIDGTGAAFWVAVWK